MSTRPSSLINMLLTLGLVTAVAAISLGFVFEFTKGPIEEARIAKQKRAIDAVLGSYDNNPLDEGYSIVGLEGSDSLTFYPAFLGGDSVGMAIKTYSNKGYSGKIWIMVGFNPDGTIRNTEVLEHKETPGLGSKMGKPGYKGQYEAQNPDDFDMRVTKDGGQVDAISGATITSRAFSEAVQLAYDRLKAQNEERAN